jgi:hypothetical protein
MKGTDNFKKVIKDYLNKYAIEDPFFAENYSKENKNIDDCCNYIIGEVHKSGCNGFTDDEIFNMAIHYYDEDNLEVKEINANVVVNHKVQLSEEEIEEVKKQAKESLMAQEVNRLKAKPKTTTKSTSNQTEQPTLFDM